MFFTQSRALSSDSNPGGAGAAPPGSRDPGEGLAGESGGGVLALSALGFGGHELWGWGFKGFKKKQNTGVLNTFGVVS